MALHSLAVVVSGDISLPLLHPRELSASECPLASAKHPLSIPPLETRDIFPICQFLAVCSISITACSKMCYSTYESEVSSDDGFGHQREDSLSLLSEM